MFFADLTSLLGDSYFTAIGNRRPLAIKRDMDISEWRHAAPSAVCVNHAEEIAFYIANSDLSLFVRMSIFDRLAVFHHFAFGALEKDSPANAGILYHAAKIEG